MAIGDREANLRSSVFNCFPCDQESNCETEMVRVRRETEFEGSRTECQSPPPQPSKVYVGVFEGKRSSDERDFFMIVGESIVVVVDGSVQGSSVRWIHPSQGIQRAHLAVPREIDSAGNTDPSELVYEISPVRFDVAGPVVGI